MEVFRRGIRRVEWVTGDWLASFLPQTTLHAFVSRLWQRDPQPIIETLGASLNRKPTLETMPFDLPADGGLQFQHLAGLFASTRFDHAVISMTVRQGAYLFGLIRQTGARRVIEIGRYKGGSTLLIAAAMNGEGTCWSIDIGEKEARLYAGKAGRSFDEQLADTLQRFRLRNVKMIVGDTRSVEVDTDEVDLVMIDGDHSYEGVKNDFDRFGTRVRVGGAVLFDDAYREPFMHQSHSDSVGRLVSEIVEAGEFRLVRAVDRMAHLERIARS